MPEALSAGSIDAYVASEPTPSLAEARGARVMGTPGGLGNSYPLLTVQRRTVPNGISFPASRKESSSARRIPSL